MVKLITKQLNNYAMKKKILAAAVAIILLVSVKAQAPDGFVMGAITLADGSVLNGYIKDNMKKDASVILPATMVAIKKSTTAQR